MKKSFTFLNNITNNSTNYTFPAGTPKKIIDYIASYGRVIRSIRKRQVLNEPDASDHRPVLVEIRMDRYTTPIFSPKEDLVNTQSSEVYDLQGRRVNSKLSKGIYVVNGKKLCVGK